MAVLLNLSDPTENQLNQINNLYQSANWWPVSSPDSIGMTRNIIQGSHVFIVAVEGNEIIGMGRTISDGVSDAYIQDITVKKYYRRNGIATQIIEMLIETLKQQDIHWVGVIAENNTDLLYRQIGFEKMAESIPLIYND